MRLQRSLKNQWQTVLLFLLIIFQYSCSKKILFVTNKTVPAARGFVQVNTDGNKNYTIKVKLSNLAEVERLLENKKTYVVWIQTKEVAAINIGQIQSSVSTFSNNLKAEFKTVSSMKPSRVFISAEENGSVTFPGDLIVLTTEFF